MSAKPIDQALDSDLRLSKIALERAALRAREVAEKTGTFLVVSRNGVIEYLKPQWASAATKAAADGAAAVSQTASAKGAPEKKRSDVKEDIRSYIRAKHTGR